jgi:hypothetical protein
VSDADFYRDMLLSVYPRLDGHDAWRWEVWQKWHVQRYGCRLPWPRRAPDPDKVVHVVPKIVAA